MKIALIIILLFSGSAGAQGPRPILVGGYEFPPYVINKNGTYQGLTLDLIELLNQKQKKYSFRFVPTASPRRYHDLSQGRYQILPFESKSWGWNSSLVDATKVFHIGGEVFITLKDGAKTQAYFKDLQNKTIRGIRGYHYGFLGLSTGARAMRGFKLEMTNTHEGNIRSILDKRADIAVVSKEYLDIYLAENPLFKDKLLISKDFDQIYRLSILVSKKQADITASDLNKLLDTIAKDNSWKEVLRKKGITN